MLAFAGLGRLMLVLTLLALAAPGDSRAQAGRAAGTTVTAAAADRPADHVRPPLPDLPALARQAFASGRPVVLMFSLPGCPWCNALRREHIAPLSARQDDLSLRVFELDLLDTRPWPPASASPGSTDPTNPAWRSAGSPRELGQKLGVRLAPTLVFLGPDGEIAERLVGYGSPDFFGAYLDQRIEAARQAMARRPAAAQ